MPTPTSPAIPAAEANAVAASPVAAPQNSNARARNVAACLGICCPKRGRCVHYSEVELPEQPRHVRTCRTPEGTYPLFEAVEPKRRTDVPVDDEGASCD